MATNRGKTYELKARFSVDADVTPIEVMEKRLKKLERRLNDIDGSDVNIKIKYKEKALAKLSDNLEKSVEHTKTLGSNKKIKPKVDSRELDTYASKLERLQKLGKKLEDSKFGMRMDNPDDILRQMDKIIKKAKSAQKEAFDLEYEAKLTGDENVRKKAQKVQRDLDKTINRNQDVVLRLQGDKEMVKLYAQAQREMAKEHKKRATDRARIEDEMYRDQAKRVKAEANEYSKLQDEMYRDFAKRHKQQKATADKEAADQKKRAQQQVNALKSVGDAIRNVNKINQEIKLTVDPSQAYRETTALQSYLRTATANALKLKLTADNSDVRRKAAESHRILSDLGNEVAKARVELDGQAKVIAGVEAVKQRLRDLTGRPWEMEISGDASNARSALNSIASQARAMFNKAYELEIRAEAHNMHEVMAQAKALRMEAMQIAQTRARLAVELDGVPKVLQGLVTVKRAAEGVEGTYRIAIDTDKIGAAIKSLGTLSGQGKAVSSVLRGFVGFMGSAQNSAVMLSRGVFIASQALMVFAIAIAAAAVAAAGPLVAGLMTAAGALGAFVAGLGLVAAVVAPVISQLSGFKEANEKAATASNTLRNANVSLEQAQVGVAKANEQVTSTARSNAQAISSAIKSHEDAVRGVDQARKQYAEAVQGVHDAERQGEEQVQNAVEAHAQAVRGVEDAHRAVGKAATAITDAQVQAQEQIQQAVRSHEMAVRGLSSANRDYLMAQRAVSNAQYEYQQATRGVAQAHRDYENAVQGVTTAQRDYQMSVRSSENAQYDYKMAQEASTTSQKELTYATEDYNDALATEQQRLLSLNYDLEGLQINQKQLALDMVEARKQMAEATTPLESQQAALRLEELQLRQKEGVLAIEAAQRSLNEAQTEGTSELQSAYDQQVAAQTGVRDAYRAQEQAGYGVQDALYAQQQAAEGITDAQLAQEDAAWGIQDALRSQADAALGVEDAIYAQGQAALGVQDAQYEVARTAAEITKAQVEGGRNVADAVEAHQMAQRNLNDALLDEQKARLGIGKAQEDSARSILDAQSRVADAQLGIEDALRREQEAREAITEAEINGAEAMANALQGVEDAERRLQDAADSKAEAQRKYNEAVADLPTEKVTAFHDAGMALWENWKKGTKEGREAMLDFGIELLSLADGKMQRVADAANGMATALIAAFWQVSDNWKNNGVFNSVEIMLRDMIPITRDLFIGIGDIFGGLINMMATASPYIKEFAGYIRDVGERFLSWTNSTEGRVQIAKFFASAAPVARLLADFIWEIGGGLVSWAVNNPDQLKMVLEGILWILRKIIYFIVDVVQWFIWLENTAPGLMRVVGAIGAIVFGLLLIPRPIRMVIAALIKMAFGFQLAGWAAATAGARMMMVLKLVGRILLVLGGVFLIFQGIGEGAMWKIALGIGLVALGLGMSLLPAVFLAAGAFLILQGYAWDSMWMIALGVGLVAVAFGVPFIGAIFLAAGAFVIMQGIANESLLFIAIGVGMVLMAFGVGLLPAILIVGSAFLLLSGGGLSALDLIAIGALALAIFFPAAMWTAIRAVGAFFTAWLFPLVGAAFTAILGVVTAAAGAMGIPVGLFVVGAIAIIGLLVVAVVESFDMIVNYISPTFAGLLDMYRNGTINTGQLILSMARTIAAAIFHVFATVVSAIPRLIAGLLSYLPGQMGQYFASQNAAIGNNIASLRDKIAGETAMMGQDIGRNLGYGASQGIGTMSRMGDSVKGIVGNMVGGVKNAMGGLTSNIIDTTAISDQVGSANIGSLTETAKGSFGEMFASGDASMEGVKSSVVDNTYGSYLAGTANTQAQQEGMTGQYNLTAANTQLAMNDLLVNGVQIPTQTAWQDGTYNTTGLQQDISYQTDLADKNATWYMDDMAVNGIGANTYEGWGYGYDNTLGAQQDMSAHLNTADIYGSAYMNDLAENGIGVNLDNAWGYADTSTLGLRDDSSQNIKESADYGSAATGEWGENMAHNISTGVGAMLRYLGTDLVNGVNNVMEQIGVDEFISVEDPIMGGMPSSWSEFVFGPSYAEGGLSPNYMANGGMRGGMGTNDKNPQHITWNEQNGNEAWVAEKGPKAQNLNYLDKAASWFDMKVIPEQPLAMKGVTGEGLGATHWDWSPEVQGYVDDITSRFGVYGNTYYGHGNLGGATEDMSADFFPGSRSGDLDDMTGDAIADYIWNTLDSNLAYMIWNGYYYNQADRSIFPWPEDPHYDHVHASWGAGGWGWGGGISSGLINRAIQNFMPDVPELGDSLIAETIEMAGTNSLNAAKEYLLSFASSGHGAVDISAAQGTNLEMGQQLAEQVGWTGSEWDALKELWTRESGWDETAVNPESGAYGIPQINPNSHGYPVGMDDAAAQIAWGIEYIMNRPEYGTPSAALAHHDAMNWYAEGGILGDALASNIDYSTTSMYSDQVREAAGYWTAAGGPTFTEYSDSSNPIYDEALNSGTLGSATIGHTPGRARFDTAQLAQYSMSEITGVIAHELGHLIGFTHEMVPDDGSSIVAASDWTSIASGPPYITEWDRINLLGAAPDPTLAWTYDLDEQTMGYVNALRDIIVSAGFDPPKYFTGGTQAAEGRTTHITGETNSNSVFLWGPEDQGFGSYYGDEGAVITGEHAMSQPGFSYWLHKGRSNIPFFQGQNTSDQLKIVWAGSMDPFMQELYGPQFAGIATTPGYHTPEAMATLGLTNQYGNNVTYTDPSNPIGTAEYTPYGSPGPTAPAAMPTATPAYEVGAGTLDDWISQGIALGGVFTDDAATHQAFYDRAMQESTGDPYAINDWDSNAMAGTPSKGLMQIIQPTWDAWTDESIGYFEDNWYDPVKSVAVSSRYMNGTYGGPVGYTGYGYARGGIGSASKDPKNITWNEGNGNEAWIAQKGPRHKNVGYLNEAASWFGRTTIPMEEGGVIKKDRSGGEDLGPTHYGWSSEVQGYVDSILSMYPNVSANTYVGHGNLGGATEDMTADFWDISGRSGAIDPATGDAISSYIWDSLGGNLAYMIWGGNYYNYDGGIWPWPEDPHYDHVHASWGNGGWGGGHADNGLGLGNMGATPPGPTTTSPLDSAINPMGTTGGEVGPTTGYGSTIPSTGGFSGLSGSSPTPTTTGGVSATSSGGSASIPSSTMNQCVNANPFTANTDNMQSGPGRQSSTSGEIIQTINGQAADTKKLATDPTVGMPGVTSGLGELGTDVTGLNTDLNTGLDATQAGLGAVDTGVAQLNSTMGATQGCVCDAAAQMGSVPTGTASPAVGTANGYTPTGEATGYGSTGTNIATNQAVDSYNDVQNTGTAQGGGNLMVGGAELGTMSASGISPETEFLGSKIDELTDATYEANEETEIGSDSLEQMLKSQLASAFSAIGSREGRNLIDKGQADKMNFDRLMSGL